MHFAAHRRVPILSGLAAAAVALAIGASPVAASFDRQTLVSSQQHQYVISGIAADGPNVAVAWGVDAYGQPASIKLRWSTDRGVHFGPPIDLGTATNAALAICGGFVAAERVGGGDVALDLVPLDGSPATTRVVVSGRPISYGAGIACVGGRQLGLSWMEYVGGAWHLKLAVVPVVEALPTYEFDPGPTNFERGFGIAATNDALWLGWPNADGVFVRRFDVANGTVTSNPRVKAARSGDTSVSMAVADGRVYVGFTRPTQAVMKVSSDGGLHFGATKLIYDAAPTGRPVGLISLAALENGVLADVALGAWGSICDGFGLYSSDWGRHWLKTPTKTGGYMLGAFTGSGPGMRLVEAWDNRASHDQLGERAAITFRVGLPR